MARERESEKFQPRMVASFDKGQLIRVFAWGRKNNVTGKDVLDRALETAEVDEEGTIMDEAGRKRLRYGVVAVSGLINVKQNVNEVLRVQMWQDTPNESKLRMMVQIGHRGIQN